MDTLGKQVSLVNFLQEEFYSAMGRVRELGRDAGIILTHLAEADAECLNLTVDDFAFLTTFFQWDLPLCMPSSYTVEQQEYLQGLLTPVNSSSLPEGGQSGLGDMAPAVTETDPSTSIEIDPREEAKLPEAVAGEGSGDNAS